MRLTKKSELTSCSIIEILSIEKRIVLVSVGIIANPSSGKDIRRLVSESRVVTNQEKINILKRIYAGLAAAGVHNVLLMPDYGRLAITAAEEFQGPLSFDSLEVFIRNKEEDTIDSVKKLVESGVTAVVVLGGDGTSRAACKYIGQIPVLPVSTGTNNVFPYMIEGTLAGLAAGFIATGLVTDPECVPRYQALSVEHTDGSSEISLVDVAISSEHYVGARAIWDIGTVSDLFLAIAEPHSIGLSAIGGAIHPISREETIALHLKLNHTNPKYRVMAPVIPGHVRSVGYDDFAIMTVGQPITIDRYPRTIALDGERALVLREGDSATVTLISEGPRTIDPYKTLRTAASNKLFNLP